MIKGLRFLATTFLIGSSYGKLITSNEFGEMLKGDSRDVIRTLYNNTTMSTPEEAEGIGIENAGKYFRAFEDFVGRVIREADEKKDDNLIDMLSVLGCYKFDGTAYKTIIDIALYNRYVNQLVQTDKFQKMVEEARAKRAKTNAENKISGFAEKVNANTKEALKQAIKESADQYQKKKNDEILAKMKEHAQQLEQLKAGLEIEEADRQRKIEEGKEKFNKDFPKNDKQPAEIKERKGSWDGKATNVSVDGWEPYNPKKVEEIKEEENPATGGTVPQEVEENKEEKPEVINPVVPSGVNVPPKVEESEKEEKPSTGGTLPPKKEEHPNKPFTHQSMIVGSSGMSASKEDELFKKLNEGDPTQEDFMNRIENLGDNDFKKFISKDFYGTILSQIDSKDENYKKLVKDAVNIKLIKFIQEHKQETADIIKNAHTDIIEYYLESKGKKDFLTKSQSVILG